MPSIARARRCWSWTAAQRPRVLSIYGGKLTTWRAVAERALLLVRPSLPSTQRIARTDQLSLTPVA